MTQNEKLKKHNMGGTARLFIFALAVASVLGSGLAHADTQTRYVERAVTGASVSIASSGSADYDRNLGLANVASIVGAYVSVYGQEGVNSLTVSINGTSCETATVGVFSDYVFRCDSAMTPTIAGGDVRVTIANGGTTTQKLSAKLGVTYQETRATTLTSGDLTAHEANMNASFIKVYNNQSTIYNAVDTVESTQATHTTLLNEINTTTHNTDTYVQSNTFLQAIRDYLNSNPVYVKLKQSLIELA